MNDHEKAAEALRVMADAIEREPQSWLTGELTFRRTIHPSRESIDRWVRSGQVYAEPRPEDSTSTLTFALKPEPYGGAE